MCCIDHTRSAANSDLIDFDLPLALCAAVARVSVLPVPPASKPPPSMSRAHVYADVNVHNSPSYYDYEELVVEWGYVCARARSCVFVTAIAPPNVLLAHPLLLSRLLPLSLCYTSIVRCFLVHMHALLPCGVPARRSFCACMTPAQSVALCQPCSALLSEWCVLSW